MKPLLVSSGEPAGVGPDLCLALANTSLPVVIAGDKHLLTVRAKQLGLQLVLKDYIPNDQYTLKGQLSILHCPTVADVKAGTLDVRNATYVLELLTTSAARCLDGEFSALITAPVHKAIINNAGYQFSGHTEFLANQCNVKTVVMMLVAKTMRVALATTHLPLKRVPETLTVSLIMNVITCLDQALRRDFGIHYPTIHVAGLNPHAGEQGHLGQEELEIIQPALYQLQMNGLNVHGPFPADTLFTETSINSCDAFVTMYHDQGLPVLKYASFGQAVNVTLGLPIIRTSVDHGTALDLAGTGLANPGSLINAVELAETLTKHRTCPDANY